MLAHAQSEVRVAHKRRYQRVVGMGLGAAGLAAAIAGMPLSFTIGLWGLAAASWAILKAV